MGRAPCCAKVGMNRGAWSNQEDHILTNYINVHGEGNWRSLPQKAGLNRCGKSCRLRWLNYLKPGIKRGGISKDEETLIVKLHNLLGNRWSLIAGRLPGRTDNEIKNYWNTTLTKKLRHKDDQTRAGSTNSSNNQQRSKEGKTKGTAKEPAGIDEVPPPPPPQVIRTKAFRCNKVILIPAAAAEECHRHRIITVEEHKHNNKLGGSGEGSFKTSSSPPTNSGNELEENNLLVKNDLDLTDDASPDDDSLVNEGGGEMVVQEGRSDHDSIFQFSSSSSSDVVPIFEDYEAGFLESWATCGSDVDHVGLELDRIASFLDLGEEWKQVVLES